MANIQVTGDEAFFNKRATFFDGIETDTITADTVTISSGKSNQFLKADGTLDSNTYLTTAPAAEFSSGTTLLFYQATAPTGYTKQTTHDNKAMRVVSGTGGGSGGTTNFTTVFGSRTPAGTVSVSGTNSGGAVSNTTLAANQLGNHTHAYTAPSSYNVNGGYFNSKNAGITIPSGAGANTGGIDQGSGGAHNHGFTNPSWSGSSSFSGTAMDFAVQYIDVIICSKN